MHRQVEHILRFSWTRQLLFLFLHIFAPLCMSSCILPSRNEMLDYLNPVKTPPLKVDKSNKNQTEILGKTAISDQQKLPTEPIAVTLSQAVLTGLSNNRQFQVERLNTPITATAEEEQKASFDPVITADVERSRERSDPRTVSQNFVASAGVSQFLPTGTKLDVELSTSWTKDIPPGNDPEGVWNSRANLSVTQALLQGAGTSVNLATVRQARLDVQISQFELAGLAQTLAADIENAYWDYFLALGQVDIHGRSLALAQRLVKETRERIALGQKARSEIFFFQAEASQREQSLIDAKSSQEKTRLRLLRMISPPGPDLWKRQIKLLTRPIIPKDLVEDVDKQRQLALMLRPDLNEARLLERRGELEIVKTRNGLLPRLDLFIMLGRTGYGKAFPGTLRDYWTGEGGLDFLTRIQLEFPLFNRKAKAKFNKSVLQLAQEREAIENLVQLAQQDVLLAHEEIKRAREQIGAASATVRFQREKREAEIEKYRLGISSAYRVAQTERDAVTSELSALQARIDYLKGLTQSYLADGSILARLGIAMIPTENVTQHR